MHTLWCCKKDYQGRGRAPDRERGGPGGRPTPFVSADGRNASRGSAALFATVRCVTRRSPAGRRPTTTSRVPGPSTGVERVTSPAPSPGWMGKPAHLGSHPVGRSVGEVATLTVTQPRKMHADEIGVDTRLVRRLIAAQFPKWSDLELERAKSAGTDNAIFRLGDRMGVRLPKIHWAVDQVDKELEWLGRLAPELPVQVPMSIAKGEPAFGYPYGWLVYEWLDGEDLETVRGYDPTVLAQDLARFVSDLRRIDTKDAPLFRWQLVHDEPATMKALGKLADSFDVGRLRELWDVAIDSEPWKGQPVWIHGDLLPGNILLNSGRLSGIIDWSATCAGDPARDLTIAWALPPDARHVYREILEPDEGTWARARGWVIRQCAQYIPYYVDTLPVAVAGARRRLQAVLDES